VNWSEECSVEKSKDLRQQGVFRELGDKWLADCTCMMQKFLEMWKLGMRLWRRQQQS